MIKIVEYLTDDGDSSFAKWFYKLDGQAAVKVTKALTKIELGNLSNLKFLKSGVHEYKIDYGPGCRVYIGRDGSKLVILLGGGTKKQQQKDIESAIICWKDYKRRKRTI